MAFDIVDAGERVASAMLRNREFAQQERDAAVVRGDQKKARKWATELLKTEKLIAEYGLTREAWGAPEMAGSSPAMTTEGSIQHRRNLL